MFLHFLRVFYSLFVVILVFCSCATLEETTFEVIDNEIESVEVQFSVPVTVDTSQVMTLILQRPHAQGGDCWGDYFFQFSSDNSIVRIYNLAEKKLVQRYSLKEEDRGFVKNCHCNSVCFGSSYYEEGDEFPLLYVSTGYGSEGYTGALVYRIIKENDSFSLSLVQTIRLPELDTSWTEFVPAGDICYVCYGRRIYVTPMPSVHNGDIILDGSTEAIEVIDFPAKPEDVNASVDQARIYHNGRIILISSVSQAGGASILVFMNLKTRTYDHIVRFRDLGFSYEPESVFFWKDSLCVAFLDQIVSFDFKPNILKSVSSL